CDTALLLANELNNHAKVLSVRYPGLASDPSHAIAKQQQQLFGFIISFELENKDTADKFLAACSLVYVATSFGGVHSIAERRARWGTDQIAQGMIRFSVGCERQDDLINDVLNALDSL
ncbi:MAG: PLP-dependent transferase, partial [Glaciecola sp.]